jgi:hypothetical protein
MTRRSHGSLFEFNKLGNGDLRRTYGIRFSDLSTNESTSCSKLSHRPSLNIESIFHGFDIEESPEWSTPGLGPELTSIIVRRSRLLNSPSSHHLHLPSL